MKAVHFVVLVDENGFGQDELDGLCYRLAQAHQIVTKSVLLPRTRLRHTRDGQARKTPLVHIQVSQSRPKPTEQLCQCLTLHVALAAILSQYRPSRLDHLMCHHLLVCIATRSVLFAVSWKPVRAVSVRQRPTWRALAALSHVTGGDHRDTED